MKSKKIYIIGVILLFISLIVYFGYLYSFTDCIVTPKYIYSSDYNDEHYDIKQKVEIDSVSSIEITSSDYKSTLSNLKYCNNLSKLILYTYDCYDNMNFLSDLKYIEFLTTTCKSKSWDGISGCTKLKSITMFSSDFSDLNLLSGFSELSELKIESEKQMKYGGLDTLTSLEKLVLAVQNADLKEISKAPKINELEFHCLKDTSNISYISEMENLKFIFFGACDIDEEMLMELSEIQKLKELNFYRCKFDFDEDTFIKYLNDITSKNIIVKYEKNEYLSK